VGGFWDGGFTDYGTAIGTVGLALVTTAAVVREGRERRELKAERDAERARADRLERQRAEQEALLLRRRLAEGVSCYLGSMERDSPNVVTASGSAPKVGAGPVECAIIQNLADKPIHKVAVHWQNAVNPDQRSVIEFGGLLEVVPARGRYGVVRPESLAQWHATQLGLQVDFTDANGMRWSRCNDGSLEELTT
jgi:hypothetical protein